jgi:hypothetical protein
MEGENPSKAVQVFLFSLKNRCFGILGDCLSNTIGMNTAAN